jgi:hypothetical protein
MSEPSQLVDLMKFANEGKPVDFNNAFQNIISQKALDAIEQQKQEVTQRIFNDDVIDNEDTNQETDSNEDVGVSDEDA